MSATANTLGSPIGLPPSAEETGDTDYASIVNRLMQESEAIRKPEEEEWDNANMDFLGNQWRTAAPEGLSHLVDNRTQNATITVAAILTEQRPDVSFAPRAVNEPALYYLSDVGVRWLKMMGQVLDLGVLSPEIIAGKAPMTEEQVKALKEGLMALAPPAPPAAPPIDGAAPAAPMAPPAPPPGIPDDALIAVDDELVSKAIRQVVDIMWDRSDIDRLWVQNAYQCSIIGHQPMLVQWDAQNMRFELSNVHPKNVHVDPTGMGDLARCAYLVWIQFADENEAIAKYPKFEQVIRDSAVNGVIDPGANAGVGGDVGSIYERTPFGRRMVTITNAWLRWQPVSPDEDEAVDRGLVVKVPADESDGTPGGLYLPDGTPTSPDNPNWPKTDDCIVVTIVAGKEVNRARCGWKDIPWTWNINIPKPFSMYGQGEPHRTRDVQNAINKTLSYLVDWLKYFRSPQEYRPRSVHNEMKGYRNTHGHPGRVIVVRDELWQRFNGNMNIIQNPPPLSGEMVQFLEILLREHDRISGNQDALQGAGKSMWSGKTVETLAAAARGPIGFKGNYLEFMVQRLVDLMIDKLMRELTRAQWKRLVPMPEAVVDAILDRWKVVGFDVKVTIGAGRGRSKSAEREQYMAIRQQGDVDRQTFLEAMDIPNAKEIIRRLLAEQAEMAMMAPARPGGTFPPK